MNRIVFGLLDPQRFPDGKALASYVGLKVLRIIGI
jgi:hypothetical protein